MSKTGIQSQQTVPWAAEYVGRSGCAYWMGIDNFPMLNCRVIGRIYWPQDDVDRVVRLGAAGADEVLAHAEPIMAANPHVWAWVLLNEASIWNAEVRAGYPAFNQRITQRLSNLGLRHVACNVNVGHPADNYWHAGIQAIGEAAQGAWALGLHGYSWPSLEENWPYLMGRFESIYFALREKGFQPPPGLLTEEGWDKAVVDGQHAGWQKVPLTPRQAADQIINVERRLAGHPDIVGTLLFAARPYEPWLRYGFEITQELAMMVADGVSQVEPPPPEKKAAGFFASRYQGLLNWDLIAREFDYVHIRAWSGYHPDGTLGLYKDSRFETNWAGAESVHMPRTAWGYFVQNLDGQAGFFRDVMDGRIPEAGYYLNLEENDLTNDKIQRGLEACDGWFETTTGAYCGLAWAQRRYPLTWARTASGVLRPLWLGQWNSLPLPTLPIPWAETDDLPEFWQWICMDSEPPFVPGTRVCLDRYRGTDAELREKYPVETPPEEVSVKILDQYGNEQDWDWVIANFGPVEIHPIDGPGYRVVQLTETEHILPMTATVLNTIGAGVAGIAVRYAWPDGHQDEITNSSGVAEHTPGGGERYWPPDKGPISWQVRDDPSDLIDGLGWLGDTQYRHLNVTFQWVEGDDNGGGDGDYAEVLDRIASALEGIQAIMAGG
jgi:hypothetical protein